jgi:hypothetical protein
MHDYSLDKSKPFPYILPMDSNPHFFLGLDDAAEALIACRKSFLTDASNVLSGTFFSISFLLFSMRGSQ